MQLLVAGSSVNIKVAGDYSPYNLRTKYIDVSWLGKHFSFVAEINLNLVHTLA